MMVPRPLGEGGIGEQTRSARGIVCVFSFWVFYGSLGRIGLPVGLADWFCVVVTATFCCPLLGVNQGRGGAEVEGFE